MATITLNVDDKTAAGFASLMKSITATEQKSDSLSQSTNHLSVEQRELIKSFKEAQFVAEEFAGAVNTDIIALGILQRQMHSETITAIEHQTRALQTGGVAMQTTAEDSEGLGMGLVALAFKAKFFMQVYKTIPGASNATKRGMDAVSQSALGMAVANSQAFKTASDLSKSLFDGRAKFDGNSVSTNELSQKTLQLIAVQKEAAKVKGFLTSQSKLLLKETLSLGKAAGNVAAPFLVGYAAIKTYTAAFDSTGRKVVAVSDKIGASAQNLAAQINSKQKTIEQVMQETGATLEELGLKAETNWTRYSDAVGKTASSVGSDLKTMGKSVAEATGIPQAAKSTWKAFDSEMSRFTDNAVENLELVREGMDKLMGRSTKHRQEMEKMAAEAERQAPTRKRVREFEENLEHQMALERKLADVRQLASEKEVQAALEAERKKREALIQSSEFRGRVEQESNTLMLALKERELALFQEAENKKREYQRKLTEKAQQEHEEHLNWLQKREDAASERRKARLKEEEDQQREIRRMRREAVAADQNRNIQLLEDRITREIDTQRDADLKLVNDRRERSQKEKANTLQLENAKWGELAKMANAKDAEAQKKLLEQHATFRNAQVQREQNEIHKFHQTQAKIEIDATRKKLANIEHLEKEAILNRAAAESNSTTDETEQLKIAAQARQDLLDVQLRHKLEYQREAARIEREARDSSIQAAREQFQAEVDLLKNKLLEEKQLREGGPSQSQLQKLAGGFNQDKVREEIVANRLQAGVRAGRNKDGRKLTEAEIRRMVIKEMQSGGLDQKEVQAAQLDLVKQSAAQGFNTGKLAKSTAKGLFDAATSIQQTNAEVEKLTQEIEQVSRFIKGESDGSRRRQAQRRSVRG